MRRAPVASLGDMFWGRGLTGKELARAEREYPSEDFLERADSFYMVTLIPQLIDTMASNFRSTAFTSSGESSIAFNLKS